MFSAVENTYLQSLIETMRGQGYENYVARTITVSDNVYDVEIVFSEKPITANGLYSYTVDTGILYRVDSSAYSQYQGGHARVVTADYSGSFVVPQYEFCYTNADFGTTAVVQPDITQLTVGGSNNVALWSCFGVLVAVWLTIIGFKLFCRR